MLCLDGDCKKGDAVELHLKRLWELNKSHERLEMTDGGGRSERFDIWLLTAAIVMSVLSENFRACLRAHRFTFAAVSTVSVLLTAN